MIAPDEHLEKDVFVATISIKYHGVIVEGDLVVDMDAVSWGLTEANFYLLQVGGDPIPLDPEDLPDSVKPKLALLKLQGRI